MGLNEVVDLEPCLDPGGLDCCGDSLVLEVLAHHRCLPPQAGCGGSAIGFRPGTVGAQLAQERALTPIGTFCEFETSLECALLRKSAEISILAFDRESAGSIPLVCIV